MYISINTLYAAFWSPRSYRYPMGIWTACRAHHLRTAFENLREMFDSPCVQDRWNFAFACKETRVFLDSQRDGKGTKEFYVIRTVSSETTAAHIDFHRGWGSWRPQLEWKLRPSILAHSFDPILSVCTSCRFDLFSVILRLLGLRVFSFPSRFVFFYPLLPYPDTST